jgi:hypothetical protein
MAISFVGSAQGDNSATLPAFNAGDIAIVSAYRDGSTTAPSLPAGWIDWPTGADGSTNARGTVTNSFRIGYRILVGGDTTTGTWTNANSVTVGVYRGQHSSTPAGDMANIINAGTAYDYGALTMDVSDGTSWVIATSGSRDPAAAIGTPTGFTNRENDVNATERAAFHDSNGGLSAYAGESIPTGVASTGRLANVIELVAAAAPSGGTVKGLLLRGVGA